MLVRRQYIVTIISTLLIALLAYALWLSDKDSEYSGLGMSIHIIFGYLIAIVSGMIAIFKRPNRYKLNGSASFYNFIGTFNICISVIGSIFVYVDNENKISAQLIMFLVTFIIGIFILENIYFNSKRNNK
jgi:hypothetical protein